MTDDLLEMLDETPEPRATLFLEAKAIYDEHGEAALMRWVRSLTLSQRLAVEAEGDQLEAWFRDTAEIVRIAREQGMADE